MLDRKLDGISDASVVGIQDEEFGEVVGVFVHRSSNVQGLQLNGSDVRNHVRGYIPQGKPDYVWFLGEEGVMDIFPLTVR